MVVARDNAQCSTRRALFSQGNSLEKGRERRQQHVRSVDGCRTRCNGSDILYIFTANAMVQDSPILYRQCSYRDIDAKIGYARWGHVQCHDMYIHGSYAYVKCTDMYILFRLG